MVQVPYKGEPPAIVDLLAGRVQVMVATGIPEGVVERPNRECNAAMNNADVIAQIEKLGFTLTPTRADVLGAMLKDQIGAYRKAVRDAGLPVE